MSSILRQVKLLYNARHCSTTNGANQLYDLVIVGGGMVGLALACAVGQTPSMTGSRVLLLEASSLTPPLTTPTQPYSNRVCALSLGSVHFLKRLNAWSHISNIRAKSFKKIHVWDACSTAVISYSSDDLTDTFQFNDPLTSFDVDSHDDHVTSDDIMGYIVENNVILETLLEQLHKCDIEVKRGVAIKGIQYSNTKDTTNPWLKLALADGSNVSTRFLVGADGAKSRVRQLAGFDEVKWSYDQSAVVATLHLEEGLTDNNVAWQRFLPNGPIALLPLTDYQSSLVWSTTPSHAKELLEMSPEQFTDAVNTALFEEFPQDPIVKSSNEFLRSILFSVSPSTISAKQLPPSVLSVEPDSRGSFPLSLLHVSHYVKPRIALIGDAAHQIHPLAGLGVNLGFGDVNCLHQELVNATTLGKEWGNLPSLLSYESERQRQNIPVMAVIDTLHRLFTTSITPIVFLRSLGLQITDAVKPFKDWIMTQTQKRY